MRSNRRSSLEFTAVIMKHLHEDTQTHTHTHTPHHSRRFKGAREHAGTWSFVGVANEAVADAGSASQTVCPAAIHALQQQHLRTRRLHTHLRELEHTLTHRDRRLPPPDRHRSNTSSHTSSHFPCLYVSLQHKTSHKGQFFEIEIYASSESRINNLSIDVWFVMIGQYL